MLVAAMSTNAQITSNDHINMAEQDLMGTSRYVAMGGAMAAVGGDASAASDNPAGLGVYRRNELMLTLDYQIDKPTTGNLTTKVSCGQASWNFCFMKDRMRGVVGNNVMLNYRRIKNFRRERTVSCANMDYSLTDVIALKTNGLAEQYLQGDKAWYDSEVGWLSKMGYEGYLIDPDSTGANQWHATNMSAVDGMLKIQESGSVDEFSFTWGMNISNQWYVGAELGVRSLSYLKSSFYQERFANGDSYTLDSYVNSSGVGFISKLGFMCRPTSYLRLGVALHAPVPMAFSLHNYGELRTKGARSVFIESVDNNDSPKTFVQPMHAIFGTAFQLGTYGLISVQYDYQHDFAKGIHDTHWVKVGAEGVVANNWFFNLGYALKVRQLNEAGTLSDPIRAIPHNSVRLDTEFNNLQHAHYLSAGVSFRHKYVVVGAAYQCRLMIENIHLHELQATPTEFATTTHKLVFSIAGRY